MRAIRRRCLKQLLVVLWWLRRRQRRRALCRAALLLLCPGLPRRRRPQLLAQTWWAAGGAPAAAAVAGARRAPRRPSQQITAGCPSMNRSGLWLKSAWHHDLRGRCSASQSSARGHHARVHTNTHRRARGKKKNQLTGCARSTAFP